MYVLRDSTYTLRNLVLDLPSVVSNGDDFFVSVLPSHDISDLKVSKLCPLLKATQSNTEHLVENVRENQKYSKKILELAFSHFSLF